MTLTYIAVGSNMLDPVCQVRYAIDAIGHLPRTRLIAKSQLYVSKPMGPKSQPDYINAVSKIDTQLSPIALLDCTQAIELKRGKVKKEERWGQRALDLDILIFGDKIIQSERLTIPHRGIKMREFVLYPLSDVEPGFTFSDGTTLVSQLKKIGKNGLELLETYS